MQPTLIEDIWRKFKCPACGWLIERKIWWKEDLNWKYYHCERCGAKVNVMAWKEVK